MKYLVTGGAGFIGSHLVDRLLEEENKVVVVDDFSSGKKANISKHEDNPNLKVYQRDICEDLDEIFEDNEFDAVFHLAAVTRVQFSIKNRIESHNPNVNGTLNLLEYCRNFGVRRFIFSSSSSVYGDQDKLPFTESMTPNPKSPYALQKLIGEQYCDLFRFLDSLETISLRYFNVYGPRQNPDGDYACLIPKFIKLIRKNKQPDIHGDGEQTRDFTYVSDVVEANLLAEKAGKECFGQVFNIGSGKNHSVNEVTAKLLKLSKGDIKPVHSPSVIEPKNTLADIEKAEKLLKWKPKVSLEEGLELTFEYFARN
ncbi:GDP-mannose 4,6-dehydratase [Candidatus Woesearchaeota archaeon]|nr:GDP-mannose 4,6-dehydratase [Candidatus Woesearchaeota archaeon]